MLLPGAWHKLLLDASGGAITNYTDPLKSVAYVGNINSLSDVDTVSKHQTGNVQNGTVLNGHQVLILLLEALEQTLIH